jgi:predicted transcriptional regulator
MSSEKKITAHMIIEALGKPPEHLVETLEGLVKEISEEKGVKVTESKVHEPKQVEEQKELYTDFVEIEIVVDEPLYLALLMFKYMPAHIEVLEPEEMIFTNHGYMEILNELTRRLHKYDEIVRVMQMEQQILQNQINKLKSEKK